MRSAAPAAQVMSVTDRTAPGDLAGQFDESVGPRVADQRAAHRERRRGSLPGVGGSASPASGRCRPAAEFDRLGARRSARPVTGSVAVRVMSRPVARFVAAMARLSRLRAAPRPLRTRPPTHCVGASDFRCACSCDCTALAAPRDSTTRTTPFPGLGSPIVFVTATDTLDGEGESHGVATTRRRHRFQVAVFPAVMSRPAASGVVNASERYSPGVAFDGHNESSPGDPTR